MYERILVPLDGSPDALRAIGPARRLARLHGAGLWLVTVVGDSQHTPAADAILEAGRAAAGEAVEATVLRGADVAATLVALDRDHPEALLCLTTRARHAVSRALFGSVAREVVGRSGQAQVLVGPACDVDAVTPIRRVIACLDGTPEGESVLTHAVAWADAAGAILLLARVVYPLVPPQAGVPPSNAQMDELGYVRRLALQLRAVGHDVSDTTVQHAHPPDALVDLAARWPDAVLAVASSTPSHVGELVTGSTAADVILRASAPVLVTRRAG